jgi:DNA gyrase/topoisomerase IV subunit A
MNTENSTPHVQKMRQCLQEQVDHLREDINKIDEPKCRAMFETSAEVLLGLIKAFDDYEKKMEVAWK